MSSRTRSRWLLTPPPSGWATLLPSLPPPSPTANPSPYPNQDLIYWDRASDDRDRACRQPLTPSFRAPLYILVQPYGATPHTSKGGSGTRDVPKTRVT